MNWLSKWILHLPIQCGQASNMSIEFKSLIHFSLRKTKTKFLLKKRKKKKTNKLIQAHVNAAISGFPPSGYLSLFGPIYFVVALNIIGYLFLQFEVYWDLSVLWRNTKWQRFTWKFCTNEKFEPYPIEKKEDWFNPDWRTYSSARYCTTSYD